MAIARSVAWRCPVLGRLRRLSRRVLGGSGICEPRAWELVSWELNAPQGEAPRTLALGLVIPRPRGNSEGARDEEAEGKGDRGENSDRHRVGGPVSTPEGRGSVFKAQLAAELAQSQRRDLADQRPKLVLAQAADPLVQLLELVCGSCHLALPNDRFAGLLPALFVTVEGVAVADNGFDQLGQCVGEAAAAIVAEDVRMLVEEHGQRFGEVGGEERRREEDIAHPVLPVPPQLAEDHITGTDVVYSTRPIVAHLQTSGICGSGAFPSRSCILWTGRPGTHQWRSGTARSPRSRWSPATACGRTATAARSGSTWASNRAGTTVRSPTTPLGPAPRRTSGTAHCPAPA